MKSALVAMSILLILLLFAPLSATVDPMQTGSDVLSPPSSRYLLGTDWLGRDVFSRLLHGGQRTLLLACISTAVAIISGVLIALAMVWRAWIDAIGRVALNVLLAFPSLLLALVVMTLLGGGGLQVALATGIGLIAANTQVARGVFIGIRRREHVLGAVALGASDRYILLHHVLPLALPPLAAYAGVTLAYSLLGNAALTFLGLGGSLGLPDWGTMLYEGRVTFRAAPWVSFAPGLLLTSVVMIVNWATDQIARDDA